MNAKIVALIIIFFLSKSYSNHCFFSSINEITRKCGTEHIDVNCLCKIKDFVLELINERCIDIIKIKSSRLFYYACLDDNTSIISYPVSKEIFSNYFKPNFDDVKLFNINFNIDKDDFSENDLSNKIFSDYESEFDSDSDSDYQSNEILDTYVIDDYFDINPQNAFSLDNNYLRYLKKKYGNKIHGYKKNFNNKLKNIVRSKKNDLTKIKDNIHFFSDDFSSDSEDEIEDSIIFNSMSVENFTRGNVSNNFNKINITNLVNPDRKRKKKNKNFKFNITSPKNDVYNEILMVDLNNHNNNMYNDTFTNNQEFSKLSKNNNTLINNQIQLNSSSYNNTYANETEKAYALRNSSTKISIDISFSNSDDNQNPNSNKTNSNLMNSPMKFNKKRIYDLFRNIRKSFVLLNETFH